MKKIVILGSGKIVIKLIDGILKFNKYEILGIIPDKPVEMIKDFSNEIEKRHLIITNLDSFIIKDADMFFSISYNKILEEAFIENKKIYNLHIGILPKYRGNSANTWAIMNNEKFIGYSIHQINKDLDDGEITFVKKIKITKEQTYSDVYDLMINSIENDAPKQIYKILENKAKIIKNKSNTKIVYCTMFSKEMGNVNNYNINSDYIVNLYRCMAKPHGSGIYINYKENTYYINKVESGIKRNVANYIGIPGKIVNVRKDEIWIKTLDNVIVYSDIRDKNDNIVELKRVFKNGNVID